MVYQKQIITALAGLAVCATPVFVPLFPKIGAYIQAERVKAETQLQASNLQTREELERQRIEERAKTSAALYETGVMPTTRKVRVTNYIDSPKKNPRLDTTIYQDDEMIDVFDSTGRCIGRIEEGRWKWKYYYQGLCSGIQNIEPVVRRK
jgi:hypothetical protein